MVKLQKQLLNKCQSKEEETELRQSYVAANAFRRLMKEVLEDKMEGAQKSSLTKDGYNCPNWAFKQADNVGYQRAMEEILKYL